jgi:hypothetical protein
LRVYYQGTGQFIVISPSNDSGDNNGDDGGDGN